MKKKPARRTRDSESAKADLLRAATEEFAAFGIAGARIDRIGAAANVNKAQIYTYFGNKDRLFDIVLDTQVARLLDEVPLTPEDLPGYAARLFDFLMKNPQPLRLANWNRMERTGGRADPPGLAASVRKKRKAIAQAQTSGQLSTRFTAEDLLAFTTALVTSWDVNPNNLRQHREAIVDAVRLLTG